MRRFVPILIITGVAILLTTPLLLRGIPKGADLANHFHFALPFYDELRAGNWHPGWLADSNWGYGDARFRFYPPGLYYLLAAARAITGNWYYAAVAALGLLTIMGGVGAYAWARLFREPKVAVFAGILFLIAPYHLNELYQASLLSEYAACAILPFVFMFVERVCRRRAAPDIAGLAASYALLVLTHLPIAVIGSLALLIYAAIRIEKTHRVSTVLRLAISVSLGLAASAFFWGTMLAELKWIKGNSIAPNPYYDYRLNFLFSRSSLTNLNNWYATLLGLGTIGFLFPGLLMTIRLWRDHGRGLKAVIAVTLTSFLMATSLSYPLWLLIPKLSEIQFPWRWLAITSLTGSLLLAMSLSYWAASLRANLQPRKLAVIFVFALSIFYVGSMILNGGVYLDRPAFETMLQDLPGASSFKDWTPVAAADLVHVQKMKAKVEVGDRAVTVTSWNPERRTFHIEPGAETYARLWTYYYPHWQAFGAGRALRVTPSEDGVIQVTVPPEATDVEVVFKEPRRARVTAFVSLFAWFTIAILLASSRAPRLLVNRFFRHREIRKTALIKSFIALK